MSIPTDFNNHADCRHQLCRRWERPASMPTASSSCEASADSTFQRNNLIDPSPGRFRRRLPVRPGLNRDEVPYDPELYFWRRDCRVGDYGRQASTSTPQIACCCFISTSRTCRSRAGSHPLGDHNDWHQHNLRSLKCTHAAASTMPQRQCVASMTIQANLNPLN